ncbi:MAG: fatty acid desaturase, partial [Limisphaerales bacterium]
MRTGQELIKATKHYAHDDSVRSWWYFLSTAGLLAATLAGTLWNHSLPLRVLCSIFAGLLMLRLFVIYHDQQHHAILPRSFLAEILMRVVGILMLSAS